MSAELLIGSQGLLYKRAVFKKKESSLFLWTSAVLTACSIVHQIFNAGILIGGTCKKVSKIDHAVPIYISTIIALVGGFVIMGGSCFLCLSKKQEIKALGIGVLGALLTTLTVTANIVTFALIIQCNSGNPLNL